MVEVLRVQIRAITAADVLAVEEASLEARSCILEEGRDSFEGVVGIVAALTVQEETRCLVLNSIDRSCLVITVGQYRLAFNSVEGRAICPVCVDGSCKV